MDKKRNEKLRKKMWGTRRSKIDKVTKTRMEQPYTKNGEKEDVRITRDDKHNTRILPDKSSLPKDKKSINVQRLKK